jgi:hypothetical protein
MEIDETVHVLSLRARENRLGDFDGVVQDGPDGMAVGHSGETLGGGTATVNFILGDNPCGYQRQPSGRMLPLLWGQLRRNDCTIGVSHG